MALVRRFAVAFQSRRGVGGYLWEGMMRSHSVAARTTVAIGALTVLAFVFTAWVISRSVTAAQTAVAERELATLAAREAESVARDLENHLAQVRGMAAAIEVESAQPKPSRERLARLVEQTTARDKSVVGYWLEMAPNAFDGRDGEFAGKEKLPGALADKNGRVSIYYTLDRNGIPVLQADDEEDILAAEYYTAARDRDGEVMVEPYPYPVDGVEVLMTSLTLPMKRQGQFIGVAGVDVSLVAIQKRLAANRPYGSGVIRLVSPKGNLLAGPELSQITKPMAHPQRAAILAAVGKGQVFITRQQDAAVHGVALQVFVPLRVGKDAGPPAILMVSVPEETVLATARALRNQVLLLGLVAAGVLALAVRLILVRLVKRPLTQTVEDVAALARGELDHPIAGSGDDEVGQVASALRKMQRDLGARLQEERRVAAVNLRVRSALDGAAAAVLIADAEGRLVYLNEAARHALLDLAEVIQAEHPDFDPASPLGQSLYRLYPDAERAVSVEDGGVHVADVRFGSHHVQLAVKALRDEQGALVGLVVNWTDRTEEVNAEQELNALVSAAAEGRLDDRITLAGKRGFFLELGRALNRLLDVTSSGVAEVQAVLAALAAGNLTVRSQAPLQGVFARMRDDANAAADALAAVLTQIAHVVEQVRIASGEIARASADLSARTEQQAAHLEEAASSLEELTSSVRENADSADSGRQLAAQAARVSGRGAQEIQQVIISMQGIAEGAKKIESIIATIDAFAFQTKILALNASVEAARAGELGRGFAVVASEVRALAQRVASSAREIKALIQDANQRVDEGAGVVDAAGKTMLEIEAAIQKVNALMQGIADASAEQAIGIAQVNETVTQMDSATQQNAAMVEQTTAAAQALADQAAALGGLTARFVLGQDAGS
jgi:methyl-accepting chemotaxis protein